MRPFCLLLLLTNCATQTCSPGTTPTLVAQLFMGRTQPTGEVTDADWSSFAADTITPRFPAGFSVLDAQGQWRGTNGIIVECIKILLVSAPDTTATRAALIEISDAYKLRFHQDSVGVVTTAGCAKF